MDEVAIIPALESVKYHESYVKWFRSKYFLLWMMTYEVEGFRRLYIFNFLATSDFAGLRVFAY